MKTFLLRSLGAGIAGATFAILVGGCVTDAGYSTGYVGGYYDSGFVEPGGFYESPWYYNGAYVGGPPRHYRGDWHRDHARVDHQSSGIHLPTPPLPPHPPLPGIPSAPRPHNNDGRHDHHRH